MQSDDESDNGSAASGAGPTRVKEPTIGAQFIIFRVLLVAGAAVSFAAGEGNQATILATAAAAGAAWSRCGHPVTAVTAPATRRRTSQIHESIVWLGRYFYIKA